MSILFPDTHPDAEALLIRLLSEAPSWRKLEMVGQMNETVKTLMQSGLRDRFPDNSPEMLKRRLADLILGKEIALRVYGPLPENQYAD